MAQRQQPKVAYNPRRAIPKHLKEEDAVYEVSPRPHYRTDHPNIIRVEGVRGGEPITRFSYISVRIIVEAITRLHETPAQVCEAHHGLSYVELSEALSYYLHHTEEIETYIAEHQAVDEAHRLSRQTTKVKSNHKHKKIKALKNGR